MGNSREQPAVPTARELEISETLEELGNEYWGAPDPVFMDSVFMGFCE